jgi:hypothetical protein
MIDSFQLLQRLQWRWIVRVGIIRHIILSIRTETLNTYVLFLHQKHTQSVKVLERMLLVTIVVVEKYLKLKRKQVHKLSIKIT